MDVRGMGKEAGKKKARERERRQDGREKKDGWEIAGGVRVGERRDKAQRIDDA